MFALSLFMDERFTPRMYIEHYAAQRGITVAAIGVAPVVIVSWSDGVIRRLAEKNGAQPAVNWPWYKRYPMYTGKIGALEVSFAQVGVGAPATVTAMEEMVACGARKFIGLGWAGSLQPEAPLGSLLVPTSCVSDEGTSSHYVPDTSQLAPDGGLVKLLTGAVQSTNHECQLGAQWTTDAPYRELRSTIEAHRRAGVLGVDMETAAMFALGQFRQVAVCNLLVVSDEVWRDWRSAAYTPDIKAATLQAERVVQHALGGLAAPNG